MPKQKPKSIIEDLTNITKRVGILEVEKLQYQIIAEGYIGIQLGEDIVKKELNSIYLSLGGTKLPISSSLGQYKKRLEKLDNGSYSDVLTEIGEFANLRNKIAHDILLPGKNPPPEYDDHVKDVLNNRKIRKRFMMAFRKIHRVIDLLKNLK